MRLDLRLPEVLLDGVIQQLVGVLSFQPLEKRLWVMEPGRLRIHQAEEQRRGLSAWEPGFDSWYRYQTTTPTRPARGPRQPGRSGRLTSVQHAHKRAMRKAKLAGDRKLEPFEFYCWRHTFGTRCAESGTDKFSLARLMGHSSRG